MSRPWTRRVGRLLNMDFDYVFKGGTWLGVDQALNVATSVATTVALTNTTTKEAYGSYSYAVSIFLILLPISLPGVSNAMVRSIARGFEGALVNGMRRRVLASLAVSVGLIGASYWFFHSDQTDVAWSLIVGGVLFPAAFAADDYKTYLHGRREFGRYAAVNGAVNVVVAAGIVAAALLRVPVPWLIGANLGTRGLANLAAYAWVRRSLVNTDVDPEFGAFGWNLSWVAAVNSVSHYLDRVLVGSLYEMETMAVYALASNLSEPLRILSVFINRLAWPKAVKMEPAEAARKFRAKFWLLVVGGAASVGACAIAFPLVIRWLFPDYGDAIGLTMWMVVSAIVGVLVTYLETYLISQDHLHRAFYWASTIRPLAVIAALYPCMAVWGYMGAVYARLGVRVVSTVVLYGLLQREYHRPPPNPGEVP